MQPAFGYQRGQQFGVMHDLEFATQLRIFARNRIEAVRARRHDLARLHRLQRRDVLLRQLLIDELVAHAPSRVAGTGFERTENRELHVRGVQQFGDGARCCAGAIIGCTGAADPEQVLDVVRNLLPARR